MQQDRKGRSVEKDPVGAPTWLVAIVWISFLAGPLGGAMLADEADRNPKSPMPGWMYIALGVMVGAVLAECTYGLLMKEVIASRKNNARREQEHEADVRREHQHTRTKARAAALVAYPESLDEETLLDPSGPYSWPADMFARLFVVPDVVILYKTKYGYAGEVRLWSKVYVAEQSLDPEYSEYRRELEQHQAAYEEGLHRDAEARREEEQRKREEDDARHAEQKALDARKTRQVVVALNELKHR